MSPSSAAPDSSAGVSAGRCRRRGAKAAAQVHAGRSLGRLPVSADRRLRLPVGLPHRRAAGLGRLDRVDVPAVLRLAVRFRRAARSRRGQLARRVLTALYVPAGRRYIPGTNMIETTWMTPQGWIRVVDALAIGEWHDNEHGSSHTRPPTDFDADHLLVRMIECIQGQVQVEVVCEPMLDYGATPAELEQVELDRCEQPPDAHDALRWTLPTAARCSGCSATSAWASRATARMGATRWSRARNASARSPGRSRAAARTPPSKPSRSSSGRGTSGAAGWPKAPIRTIPGARTCSARRWCSRA